MSFGDEQPPPTTEERITRLNEHIERLRADRRPTVDASPDAEDAPLFQMAALFRAATPGAADPDPAFAANLLARLLAADAPAAPPTPAAAAAHPMAPATDAAFGDTPVRAPVSAGASASVAPALPVSLAAPTAPVDDARRAAPGAQTPPAPIVLRQERAARRRDGGGFSRRGLLAGGLGAAAAAVVGAVGGAAIERAVSSSVAASKSTPLVWDGAGAWVAIAPVAELPVGAVKHFQTEYIVGFIRHTAQGFSALSGVCTHMSCLLVWNTGARTFDCPCHGGRFTADGQAAASSPIAYSPLPAIQTKVEQEQVWVYVIPPLTPTSPSPSSGGYGADQG